LIGAVGGILDNALMESQIGLYEMELIIPRNPWHVSPMSGSPPRSGPTGSTTASPRGDRRHPAREQETNYYAQHQPQPAAEVNA
jgi:putative transposase